jgi:hypothetical protein
MAGWGEGPLRDPSEGTQVSPEERYGPNAETIERMIAACDTLSLDQLKLMAHAHGLRGLASGIEAWNAAQAHSDLRVTQAGACMWDVEVSLKSNGFDVDAELIRVCGHVATEAALAVSTQDLIGTAGYFVWDYDRLLYPWRVGAGEP